MPDTATLLAATRNAFALLRAHPAATATEIDALELIPLLTELVGHHAELYHTHDAPVLADADYDALLAALMLLEQRYPQHASPHSPTQRVGNTFATVSQADVATYGEKFSKQRHAAPMLSLDNSYSWDDVQVWLQRMQDELGVEPAVSVEWKLDGLGVAVQYRHGRLTRAVTRGDGSVGEDITENFLQIAGCPHQLIGTGHPPLLELVGEVLMPRSVFAGLVAAGQPFATARNAAAGSLRQLDSAITAQRGLQVLFYHASVPDALPGVADYAALHLQLSAWGLPHVAPHTMAGAEQLQQQVQAMEAQRDALPWDVDGVVLKCTSYAHRRLLGATSHHPRWAMAYKYAAPQAHTRLLAVTWQVGRTGAITPVAELQPVNLGGTTVARATLHNTDELARLGIRIGDTVVVERAGEVIPAVLAVDPTVPNDNPQEILAPATCPSCGTALVREDGYVALLCPASGTCPAQLQARLEHAVGKYALAIDGLGTETIAWLAQAGVLRTVADFFTLTREQLLAVPLYKEKKVANVLAAIEASRSRPLPGVVLALGIHHVGRRTAELLAERYGTLAALSAATLDELSAIYEIGPATAESIVAFFASEAGRGVVRQLTDQGVGVTPFVSAAPGGTGFAGQVVAITGSLQHFTRDALVALLRAQGARVVDTVTAKTTLLIAGEAEGNSSKLKAATKQGTPVWSEEQLLADLAAKGITVPAAPAQQQSLL